MKADIGLIGLAVMGENLAMNMESHGFRVAVFNRTQDKLATFLEGRARGKNFMGATNLQEFVSMLELPRRIILMIKAGKPVDDLIEQLLPLLTDGDIIIDGGNSNFLDTIRRTGYVESQGKRYVGTGISGGEEGALKGPAIMPGGSVSAWPYLQKIFQSISAKVDGEPCCHWVGADGAGHFVKMVHNGIEYGDMQLICEAYHLMRDGLGMSADEMHHVFREWNEGLLDSYLIEITGNILAYHDEDGSALVDKILDTAGQKGTGKWTVVSALDEGVPLTLIGEAVFSRSLSALKDERVKAAPILEGPSTKIDKNQKDFLLKIRDGLFASKIVSYAQGFALIREAAKTFDWKLDLGAIALLWRGGCIIRSAFLGDIKLAYERNKDLANLMLDDYFRRQIEDAQAGWRDVCATAMRIGIPAPAMTSALSYYDAYRCARLPANLLQAQRDYFGAHTYERIDRPRGEFFHTNWTGEGGDTSSTTYNA